MRDTGTAHSRPQLHSARGGSQCEGVVHFLVKVAPTSAASLPGRKQSPPVFACGEQIFSVDDVMEAARALGRFDSFESAWREEQARAHAAAAAGLTPTDEDVNAAIEAFRYSRDLISAEDCERWLAARGLTYDDLVGCCTRRLQAGMADAGVDASVAQEESSLPRDAMLADHFNGWAKYLARCVAVATERGNVVDTGEAGGQWKKLEAQLAVDSAAVVTPANRRQILAAERLSLTRVRVERAEFDSAAAIREAILCAREDGATLGEIARSNGLAHQTAECFLGDLPAELAERLRTARLGDMVCPPQAEHSFAVFSVVDRHAPALEDPVVCQRLDAALVERRLRELESRHIRWLIDVEMA